MKNNKILVAVSKDKNVVQNIPSVIVKDEKELDIVSTELARIFEGDVYRLSNGIVIITTSSTANI